MPKCEHHDDYIKLHAGLKDHINLIGKTLDDKITATNKNVETAFTKIDGLRDTQEKQGKDHIETETYVKTLYTRFGELTQQMQNIVTKLDTYITAMATVQRDTEIEAVKVKKDTENNSAFNKKGKDLVYEIIKWLVILALGYALNNGGKP